MSDTLFINNILNSTFERKATDVHLVAGNNPVIRVDGRLVTMTDEKLLTPDILNSLVESILDKDDLEKLTQQREVVSVYNWSDRARFRAKIFYQKGYPAISLRLIPPSIRSPKDLGIPAAILQILRKDKGLLVITGPYGSGRTTTAASLLETLNQNKGLHIQTLEKPIEYLFLNNQSIIEQRQVGKDVNSFVEGLEDILDEDVDVVFVDAVYEEGMEELLLQLAEGGKFVIAVMDANSSISALERFISNLPEDKREWGSDLLSEVLEAVLVQRLLPRVGGGMSLAVEVLTSIPAVKSSIKDRNFHQLSSIIHTSKDEGMLSLDSSLSQLVKVGEISLEDAKKQAQYPESIK